MYLFITKCSDPLYWYKDLVGHHIPLVREDSNFYWSRELISPHCINIINKNDAEVVTAVNDSNFGVRNEFDAPSLHNNR